MLFIVERGLTEVHGGSNLSFRFSLHDIKAELSAVRIKLSKSRIKSLNQIFSEKPGFRCHVVTYSVAEGNFTVIAANRG